VAAQKLDGESPGVRFFDGGRVFGAFSGLTPDEAFFRSAPNLSAEFYAARAKARELRLALNRGQDGPLP
jgi:hypothetical protein